MSDILDSDDLDQLRDLVQRVKQAAKTARRIGPANAEPVHVRLLVMAEAADEFIGATELLIDFAEVDRVEREGAR